MVLEQRLIMRVLEKTRMHGLRHRATAGEADLRAILDAIGTMRRCGAAALWDEHGDQLLAVGGPIETDHQRREQRGATHLRRAAGRDVGDVGIRGVGEVGDVRHLRT